MLSERSAAEAPAVGRGAGSKLTALALAISCSLIAGCGSSSNGSTTQKAATTSPPATTASTTTKTTTHKIGESAAVGTLRVQPTSLARMGTASGPEGQGTELNYRLTVTLKNEGTQSATPFCAGEHASLNDVKGRVFEGEDLKPHESGSVNCVPLSAGQERASDPRSRRASRHP